MLTAKGQLKDRVKGINIGADFYLPKPYAKDELEAMIKSLLKRTKSPPFANAEDECTFCISCKPSSKINIGVSGAVTLSATSKQLLDIDVNAYARRANESPNRDWRFNYKVLGQQLYEKIFTKHPLVLANYRQALGEVKDEEKLHLRFESTRNLLRVPLEFLFEGLDADGDYLVLNHPLARCITGVRIRKKLVSPSWLNQLSTQNQDLKILLIASNTRPAIPGVDQEISTLSGSLEALFTNKHISVQVKTIPTEHATYETVRRELERCKYHIIHYAGHGTYDSASPEKSFLSFWEQPNSQGQVERMPISELQMLLRGSKTRLIYLSCCFGTKTGHDRQLLDDDFLGIADGLIQARIPAVLGYRWPVSDTGAKKMALAFYTSLAKQGQIDTALLDARCELAARNRDDITWLSPILIMQG